MSRRIGAKDIAKAALRKSWHKLATDFGGPARVFSKRTGRTPQFESLPPSLGLGDTETGLAIIDGQIQLGAHGLDIGAHGDPWSIPAPSQKYAENLHGFRWLNNLSMAGLSRKAAKANPAVLTRAQSRAQYLIDRWITVYGQWNPFAWREDILALRIYSWLTNWQVLLLDETNQSASEIRRSSLGLQLKRLHRVYGRCEPGMDRLRAAACLVIGGACFAGKQDGLLEHGLDLLDDEIDEQILQDGGHISRSPGQTLQALEILLQVEMALDARGIPGSREIRRAIDRMAPIVSFFTADDGRQFSFHGGGIGNPNMTRILLAASKIKSKPFGFSNNSKYQRLSKNGNVLMLDAGGVAPRPHDTQAHLAPLAFEMSTPAGALIVNCGWNQDQPQNWREAVRKTAAHSTLVLNDEDTGKFLNSNFKINLLGPVISQASNCVQCKRNEHELGTWLQAHHNGYVGKYGLCHDRQVYMDLTGTDVRGEDQLYVPIGATPKSRDLVPFALRFHIHPNVKVTLAQDGRSALMIQKGGKAWRFKADRGPLKLEKSVYLATGSRPRPTEQLVVYGQAYGDSDGKTRSNRVTWTIKHMANIVLQKGNARG